MNNATLQNNRSTLRKLNLISFLMAGLLCIVLLPGAQAGWNQSGAGPYNYTNTANWDGGIIDHQFTNTLTASQTIQFTVNTSVTNLTYAPSGTVNTPTPSFASSGGPFTLTLNGTTRFVPWVNVSGVVGPRLSFGSFAANQALNISLAGSSPTLVSEYAGSGNSRVRFLNVISGNTALATEGNGVITLEGANTFTGPLNINNGHVRIMETNGAVAVNTINLAPGAKLEVSAVDATTLISVITNRIPDTATINLNGGYSLVPSYEVFNNPFYGNFLSSGVKSNDINASETVGTINLQSGLSRVSARVYDVGSTYGSNTLTIGSLTRATGAACVFAGGRRDGASWEGLGGALNSGVGAQSFIKFTTPPTMTQNIIPYAVIAPDKFNYQSTTPTDFASYNATAGVVPYSRYNAYVTNVAASASASDNVMVTNGETVAASKTVNSLTMRLVTSSTLTIGSGQKLTIGSGAILKNNLAAGTGEITGGSLGFNNQEAFVFVTYGRLKLSSTLTDIGAGGINLVGPLGSGYQLNTVIELATLSLGAVGTPVRILMGTVSETGGQLVNRALTIHRGGTYSVQSTTGGTPSVGSLAGEGTIRLSGNNTAANTDNTLTIGSLNTDSTFAGSIHAGELVNSVVGFANTLVTGGNIIKTGTGSLTLSGPSTYTGTTTVRQGTLITGGDVVSSTVYGSTITVDTNTDILALGSGTLANGNIIYFSASTVPGGLVLDEPYIVRDVSGSNFKVSQYSGGPAVDITTNGVSVTVVRPGLFGATTSAIVLGDSGTGSTNVSLLAGGAYTIERDITVANQGSGTTTIGGNTNTASYYTGTITLNKAANLTAATNGTVYFNATGSGKITGSAGVNITGQGTVVLGAANDYAGLTTVKSNAVLAGSGKIPAGLAFEATGKLAVTLTPTPGAYTPMNVTGSVDVSGATLQIAPLTFAPTIGSSYVLISNDGSDAVVGQFATTRYSLIYNGHEYTGRVRTNGGTGNDVVLEFPAKGTVVMMQ